MTEEEATLLGNAILSEVTNRLSIPQIRLAAAAAGIDASQIPARSEAQGSSGSRAEVTPALFRLYSEMSLERKERALPILAERVMNAGEEATDRLKLLLGQHGYEYLNRTFVPVGLFDTREMQCLPQQARTDLSRAMTFLAGGDTDDVAVALACGAVDKVVEAVYAKNGWADRPYSFQAGVNTAMKRLAVFEEIEAELIASGIDPTEASNTTREIACVINHAAQALQVIRKTQGVAHGTRPTHKRIVYDTIKLASAICGLLEGKA